MAQNTNKSFKLAKKTSDKPPSKKRNFADASKHPETVTTLTEIVMLLREKDSGVNVGGDDLLRIQTGVENFALELVVSVIQCRENSQLATATGKKGDISSKKVPRISSEEIWKALATSESFRPIARRFVSLGLVPAQHQHLFNNLLPVQEEFLDQSEDEYSEASDFNDFLLDAEEGDASGNNEDTSS